MIKHATNVQHSKKKKKNKKILFAKLVYIYFMSYIRPKGLLNAAFQKSKRSSIMLVVIEM